MRKANPKGWNTIRVIAIARAVSILGDELAIFALLLRVKHNGGGAFSVAMVLMAGQLPLILLSPWAGTLADRVPVRKLAPVVNLIQAALAALLAFRQPFLISLLLVCLLGIGQSVVPAAWNATLPEITDKEEMPRAMSLMQALYAMAGMAGPAVAGVMVSKFGYSTPMIANALSFLFIAAVPLFLTLPFHPRERGERKRGDVWVGLQIVRKEPVIRALAILGFSLNVSVGMITVSELFFTLDDLHATTYVYGLAGSTFAAFTLIAALINKRRTVSEKELPLNIIVGAVVTGLGLVLNGASWHWLLLFPTLAIAGYGVSTVNAYYMALILQRSNESSRGRVLSAVTGVAVTGQISSLAIGGIVISIIDPRFVILFSGAACLLVTGLLAPSLLAASRSSRIFQMEPDTETIDFPVVETE